VSSQKGVPYDSATPEDLAETVRQIEKTGHTSRDLSTTVMGQDISFPVICSPTGVQAIDPEGEVAVARAAQAAGTAMGLSSFASKPVEEVGQVVDKLLFQSYWVGTRDDILARAERARAAGAKGLIVTLDWVFDSRRDWGSPWIPEKLDVKAVDQGPGPTSERG
jgi:pre-mycofactocin synthase